MNKLLILVFFLMLIPMESFACARVSPQSYKPWMILSEDGKILLKMVPGQWKEVNEKLILTRKPYTIAYAIEDNGYLKQLWSMREAYRDAFVASNGRNLLVMQNIYKVTDIAIIIYRDGKKVKTFTPANFGVTNSMLKPFPRTACEGWSYWTQKREFSNDDLVVRTTAGKSFALSINTGKIAQLSH